MDQFYKEETHKTKLYANEVDFFKMDNLYMRTMATHPHFHNAIEVIYMTEGSAKIIIDGITTTIYPGDLALFSSRSMHEIWTLDEEENAYYCLKLMPRVLYNISRKEEGNKFSLRFITRNPNLKTVWRKEEISGTKTEIGLNLLIESLDKNNKTTLISKIISALMVLEGLYSSDTGAISKEYIHDEKIYNAVFYINEHYAEQISVDTMLSMVNMSQSKFSKSFKSATGKSFKDYLNTTRTDRAEEMLKNTDLSVKDIAVKAGYNNIANFISIYKKYKGKSPHEER